MTEAKGNIGKAILKVMKEVGYVQKESSPELRYTFAGEVALIKALRPSMLKHGIFCHVEDIPSFTQELYTTKKGTVMNRVITHGVVRFEHPASGTFVDAHAIGEAADAGDKASNKAATGLLKYALRQTFLIETGDDPDASASAEMERAQDFADKATDKKGSDAVTMFWQLANKLEITKEQAQQVLDDQGGSFVDAYDALTASNIAPEEES